MTYETPADTHAPGEDVGPFELRKGTRAKFFHPGTMGVMLRGTVRKLHPNGDVTVLFDDPHPNGRRTFRVPPNHLRAHCGQQVSR